MTLLSLENYGPQFQVRVLSSLLTRKEFLDNVYDFLSEDDFGSQAHKWIINQIKSYHSKYNTTPTMEVLKIEMKKITNEVLQVSIKEQLRAAYENSGEDLEYIEKEFFNFCKNQALKKALLDSMNLLKNGEYDSIRSLVDNALKAGQVKNIGHVYDKDIESRYRDENRKPIPFPWEAFNKHTSGGYGSGELILIFGPPKTGKSWVTIDMAAHAAMVGFNVLYYTLELSENYVGKRVDAYLSGIELDKLAFNREKVESTVKKMKGRLIIKEFTAGKASLDTIEAHIRQLKSNQDFVPDVVFIDYLDLLKNKNKTRKEKIDDIDDIYVDARALGKEHKIPVVSPSQINRAGANDEVIQQDKIAGAFSKFFTADLAISFSRTRKDKVSGTGRFYFMGNRMGPDGITFTAKVNTANGAMTVTEDEGDDDIQDIPRPAQNTSSSLAPNERNALRSKFFELNT